jgi:hypothetical protein
MRRRGPWRAAVTALLLLGAVLGPVPGRRARADGGVAEALLRAPRLGESRGLTRVQATVRPFLNLVGAGGGAIADLSVEHYFERPLKLSLNLAPVALAVQPGADSAIGHLRLGAAYATEYIEIGAAVGARVQNLGHNGVSLAAALRLGRLDGTNVRVSYGYALARNYYTRQVQTGFSHLQLATQVSLTDRLALVVEGALSFEAWMFATGGLRHRVFGDGGAGSWFVTGQFGFAWVLDHFRCQYHDPAPCRGASWALGPTLVFGLERRF